MKKNYLLLAFLLIYASILFGQNAEYTQTIRGKVIDKQSHQPLPGATIVLLNSDPKVGTVTDFDGEFKLENIDIGRQGIQVSFMGYNPGILNNLNLTSGKELVLNISLEEQVVETEEIVISARKPKDQSINEMATVSARSFSIEETERYAGSLGDPSRMASNFAGVAMTNDSRNDIIIRGNSPSGLLWRLDGFEIPNPNHFGALGTTGGPVSMLNNNLLTNSDFFTGAFPAQYGNATSGVFDLKMRPGNNQNHEFVGQVGFNGFELGAEGPFSKNSKASYLINYRYSTLGLMSKMGLEFGTGLAVPQYQDLSFKLNFPSVKYGKLTLIGIGGLSYIEIHDSEKAADSENEDSNYDYGGVDLDFGSDMGIVGLSHQYFFNERTRIETFLSVMATKSSTYIDSLRFGTQGEIVPNSNYTFYGLGATEVKYSASTHLKTKFNAKNSTEFGVYYDLYQINYLDSVLDNDIDGGFRRSFDIDGNISLMRVYAQWQHRFNDKATLNTGVYTQYIDINKELSVEPRLGFKYKFNDKQSFSLGYGMHSQSQPRHYYFVQTRLNDGSHIFTNKNLNLTKSHQIVFAYDALLSKDFRIKTELYYQNLYDVPVSPQYTEFSMINTGVSFGGAITDSLVSEGTGTNYGFELTLEKFFNKGYYFLATVSVFESKYKGYSKIERNTAFNGNFVSNLLGGYEFKIGKHSALTTDLRIVYAGGKRYIPIDIDASIAENQAEYDWSKAYENKWGNYFRTDLRIGFKMNGKRLNQEWAIDLQNVTG
ncbi:MAG: TonB-dependent receptor, partial [Bacteroidetes bacterium 4572_117]